MLVEKDSIFAPQCTEPTNHVCKTFFFLFLTYHFKFNVSILAAI